MNRKSLLIKGAIILCAVLFVGAAIAIYFSAIKKPDSTQGTKTVTMEFVYADQSYSFVVSSDADNLFDLLKEQDEYLSLKLQYTSDPLYGAYVTSFFDVDAPSGAYYSLYVDDEYSMTGVSDTTLKTDSIYSFRLVTFDTDTFEEVPVALDGSYKIVDDAAQKRTRTTLAIIFSIIGGLALAATAVAIVFAIRQQKQQKANLDPQ